MFHPLCLLVVGCVPRSPSNILFLVQEDASLIFPNGQVAILSRDIIVMHVAYGTLGLFSVFIICGLSIFKIARLTLFLQFNSGLL